MNPIKRSKLSINSTSSNFNKVERFIDNLLDEFRIPKSLRSNVTLCTVEAANNSLLHGNKLNPEKIITISAEQYPNKISVIVEDEGEGFNYRDIPDPTTPENITKVAGRGLYIMSSLSDELLFHLDGRKVIMSFFLDKE